MTSNWKTNKIGNMCIVGAGNSAPQDKEFFINGVYPFFRTSDVGIVHVGKIDQSASYLNDKGIKGMRLFKKGTILFPKSGASTFLNHRVIMGVDGYVSSHLATIKTDDSVLTSSYLFYFLQKIKAQDLIQDHKYPSLNLPVLRRVEIYYPQSLSEQNRIAKTLDDVFEKIAKQKEITEKNLKNSKDLFESYLHSAFANPGKNWHEKKIGDICNLMTGGTPSRNKKEYFEGGAIRWLVSGDVNRKEIFDCDARITELGMRNSNAKYLPLNSVIIALNGQGKTRGTVAMLRSEATCNQSLVSIYPKNIKQILPEFIYHNLNVRYQEIRKITGDTGNDRRGLNMPLIRNITIHYPESIKDQEHLISKFNSLLTHTQKLESIYKQKLTDLEELKKSVLNLAFTGQL
jgi:type I restriction enzyme S subunit